jgi:hypothetical protein
VKFLCFSFSRVFHSKEALNLDIIVEQREYEGYS